MSVTVKKQAERLLERFKKEYDRITKEMAMKNVDQMQAFYTTCLLDSFWYDNPPSNKEVSDEIVKLATDESMEIKVLLNSCAHGGFNIPQKLWFLGAENSLDLLPRQPSNIQCEFISILNPDGQVNKTTCINMLVVPHLCQNEKRIKVTNDEVSVLLLKKDEHRNDWFYRILVKDNTFSIRLLADIPKRLEFSDQTVVTKYQFRGTIISLVEGKLVSENPVIVYLGNKRMNEGIVQWALKTDGAQVLLLYDTFFMATGKVQKTKTGFLIKCYELYGSYGTGSFMVSPNFKVLVRMSAINKKVDTTTKKPDFDRLIDAIEVSKEPDSDSVMTTQQKNLLYFMCMDAQILVAMKKQYVSDPAPGHYLTEFEKFVHNYHRVRDQPSIRGNFCGECAHRKGKCLAIKNLIAMAEQWIQEEGVEHDGSFAEFVYYTALLLEIYSIAIIINREEDVSLCRDVRFMPFYEDHHPNPFKYFPLNAYKLTDPEGKWDFAAECLTQEVIAECMPDSEKKGKMADLYLSRPNHFLSSLFQKRPDLILFGGSKMSIPLTMMKSFAQWYEKTHFNAMKNQRKIEGAVENLNLNQN